MTGLIPTRWFRAETLQTVMRFLTEESQARTAPLAKGQRALGWFVLPDFQRPPAWTEAQQVRFVESCWLGLPIGAFVFNRTYNDGPNDALLLDGQQRVTAVLDYMAGRFAAFGMRYDELGAEGRREWARIPFTCLQTNLETHAQLAEVYDRLAYGGTPHEPKT